MAKVKKGILTRFFVISSIILLSSSLVPLPSSLATLLSSLVYAAVPHLINYQGRLTDSSGTPLNGAYSLTFRIYDAETAGNLLWQETHSGVVIQKGIFGILLGSVTNLDLPFDKSYFLEIKVGNEVMSPRQRITSSAYAIRAETAEDANTIANVGVSTIPAPNKLLPLDTNGKLTPAALKVYDSGWFAFTPGAEYLLTHNLGTTKVVYNVYVIIATDPSNIRTVVNFGSISGSGYGAVFEYLLPTNVRIQIGGQGVGIIDNNGTLGYATSGQIRIIMLALE